jgi:MSHA biogenesis protein MshL
MNMNSSAIYRALITAGLSLLIGACNNLPPRTGTLDKIDKVVSKGAAKSGTQPVPADVANALLPTIRLTSPDLPKMHDEQRFDISVNDVPAAQFFMSLVDGTKYNMVVHPEVTGTITLHLKNATIPEVLEAARDVYGYEFTRTPYGFEVLPARLEARVYQINYLDVIRRGESSTFVSSGTLQRVSGVGKNGKDDNGGATSSSDGRHARAVVGTEISTEQPKTTFWSELRTAVTAIVGDHPGRTVVVNPESGVVVVRALPNELREVETFLRTTQLIAERQVILEAKILEVTLSDGYQTGINWSALAGDFAFMQTGGGQTLDSPTGRSEIAGSNVTVQPGVSNLTGTVAKAFGGVFAMAVNGNNFAAFIELLKTQGNVQVLSSPRIATTNNQKALIKVGTDEFFVTDVSTTTVTGTATTSTPSIELTPFFSGIALDVTPQISEAGDVTLHIHPSVSQVSQQDKSISIGGVTQTLPLARSTVRESDSIVRAHNGQVVVIGGLMQDSTSDQDAKTPILGDLPWVGGLFGHKKTGTQKSELVILLRPVVVQSQDQWADAVQDSSANLGRLREQLDRWAAQRRSITTNPMP